MVASVGWSQFNSTSSGELSVYEAAAKFISTAVFYIGYRKLETGETESISFPTVRIWFFGQNEIAFN